MSLKRKVLYFTISILLIISFYRINFSLDNIIPQEIKDYQTRSKINSLSSNVIQLSKTLNELKKKKEHNRISLQRKAREESFRKGRNEASKVEATGIINRKKKDNYNNNEEDDKLSNHIITDCLKASVQNNNGDPLKRSKSLINDKDTRKRKKIIKIIPHSICPLSLNPKKNENEYLYWIDKAQKKHMKFQKDYLNKIDCKHHRSTAQFSQDIRLHRRFFKFENDLIFVEVGAFDGVVFSNTYFEEFCLGWKGLCIEPQRRFAGIIQKSRTCGVVNSAVSLNDDVNVDIRVGGVLGGKIGTLSKEVRAETLSKTYPEHQNTVKGFRLSTIFLVNKVKKIDHLSIDCEGCELQVLESIDFEAVSIRLIQIERNDKGEEIKKYLDKQGYTWVEDLGEDSIHVINEEVGKYQK